SGTPFTISRYWAAVSSHRCHSLSLSALIIKSSDRAVKLPWENGAVNKCSI
ncbi:hypothetical protein Ddye_023527, partial [Dipteronia dyeriana]